MALLWIVSCGRSPLEGDTLASASGRASGSDDATNDEGISYDGPSIPDDDGADVGSDEFPPPPDDPLPDFGSRLPPAACAMAPPLPAGPSCANAPTVPRQLLDLEGWSASLTVDDDSIYVVVKFWESSIYRIDKCSGEVSLLGPAGMNPGNIVVVDDRLLWTDYVDVGALWEMPKDGGDPIVVGEGTMALGLTLADDWIFYSAHEGLFRMPRSGGTPELWVGPERWYIALSYDGVLLFANDGLVPSVAWVDPLDGSFGGVATPNYGDVLADCEWVFWANEFAELQRLDRATGSSENLATRIYRLTQDATRIYATTGDSRVLAIDKASGDTQLVGDNPGEIPWRVAVDETHVYWTFADSGDVWMAPKP